MYLALLVQTVTPAPPPPVGLLLGGLLVIAIFAVLAVYGGNHKR
jgi:hypothetical protein